MQLKNNTLAIDIGGTHTRFVVFDNDLKTVFKRKNNTKKFNNYDNFLNFYKKQIEEILIKRESIEYIVFSIAAPVIPGPFQRRIPGLPIGEYENSRLLNIVKGKEIKIINDANAAALAEYYVGNKLDNFIYITISSGVGGGIIKNGKLTGLVEDSEVGYIELKSFKYSVSDENYWQDFLGGKKGIVNYYNIFRKNENKGPILETAKEIFNSKDPFVVDFLINEIGKLNAEALEIIHDKLKVNKVVFGGSVALNNKKIIVDGLKKYLKKEFEIYFTEIGDEICALGAAIYASGLE